jgi:hypothetical protein
MLSSFPYNAEIGNVLIFNGIGGATYSAWTESSSLVWVNLGRTIIPAGGTTNGILYGCLGSASTNFLPGTANGIGEAPQLSSSYGQYDNGWAVFNALYANFAGTTTPPGWSEISSGGGTIIQNNGVVGTSTNSNSYGLAGTTSTGYGMNATQIVDFYGAFATFHDNNWACQVEQMGYGGGMQVANNGITGNQQIGWCTGAQSAFYVSWTVSQNIIGGDEPYTTPAVFSTYWPTETSQLYTYNYNTYSSGMQTGTPPNGAETTTIACAANGGGGSYTSVGISCNWIRLRTYPPNGVQPTVTFGAVQVPITSVSIGSPSNGIVDQGQFQSITATISGGTPNFAYGFNVVKSSAVGTIANVIKVSSTSTNPYTATWYVSSAELSDSPIKVNVIATDTTPSTANSVYSTAYNVYPAFSALAISPNTIQQINVGGSVSFVSYESGGATPIAYQWRSGSSSCNLGSTPIGGATSSTYTPTGILATTYYCLTATDSATTNEVITTPATEVLVSSQLITFGSQTITYGSSTTVTATCFPAGDACAVQSPIGTTIGWGYGTYTYTIPNYLATGTQTYYANDINYNYNSPGNILTISKAPALLVWTAQCSLLNSWSAGGCTTTASLSTYGNQLSANLWQQTNSGTPATVATFNAIGSYTTIAVGNYIMTANVLPSANYTANSIAYGFYNYVPFTLSTMQTGTTYVAYTNIAPTTAPTNQVSSYYPIGFGLTSPSGNFMYSLTQSFNGGATTALFTNQPSGNYLPPSNQPSGNYVYTLTETESSPSATITMASNNLVSMNDILSAFTFNNPVIQYYPNFAYTPTFSTAPLSWYIKSDYPGNIHANTITGDQFSNANLTYQPYVYLTYNGFNPFPANLLDNPGMTQLITQSAFAVVISNTIPANIYNRPTFNSVAFDLQWFFPWGSTYSNTWQLVVNNYSVLESSAFTTYLPTNSMHAYTANSAYQNPPFTINNLTTFATASGYTPQVLNNYCPFSLSASQWANEYSYLPNANASLYAMSVYLSNGNPATNYTLIVQSYSPALSVLSLKLVTASGFNIYLEPGQNYRFLIYNKQCNLVFTTAYNTWNNPISLTLSGGSGSSQPPPYLPTNFTNVVHACYDYLNTPTANTMETLCTFSNNAIPANALNMQLLIQSAPYGISTCANTIIAKSGTLTCWSPTYNNTVYSGYLQINLGNGLGWLDVQTFSFGAASSGFGLDAALIAMLTCIVLALLFIRYNMAISVILVGIAVEAYSLLSLISLPLLAGGGFIIFIGVGLAVMTRGT